MPMHSASPASGFAARFQLTWQYLPVMHSSPVGWKQKHSTTKTTGGRRALQAYNSHLRNLQDTGTNALLEAMKKPGVKGSSASGTLLLVSQRIQGLTGPAALWRHADPHPLLGCPEAALGVPSVPDLPGTSNKIQWLCLLLFDKAEKATADRTARPRRQPGSAAIPLGFGLSKP